MFYSLLSSYRYLHLAFDLPKGWKGEFIYRFSADTNRLRTKTFYECETLLTRRKENRPQEEHLLKEEYLMLDYQLCEPHIEQRKQPLPAGVIWKPKNITILYSIHK